MTVENIGLIKVLGSKMRYLTQRQEIINQNIANSDTPGYVSQDLNKVDFSRMVQNVMHNKMHVMMEKSNPGHLLPPDEAEQAKEQKNRKPFEVAPDGNAVVLEEQMLRASKTQVDYSLMVNLYRNNVDMIRASLGNKQ